MSTLTVLTAFGRRQMAKQWLADGTIRPTDEAKWFTPRAIAVGNLLELSVLLTELAGRPQACVVRQVLRADAPERLAELEGYQPGRTVRQAQFFEDRPLHPIMIDVDGYPWEGDPVAGMRAFVLERLPECFHGVDFHWHLSGGYGHPSKAGKLNAHLWFWLRTPYTSAQLYAWAKALGGIDAAVYRPVQAHYTADPVLGEGVTDPVRARSGLETFYLSDEVDLVLTEAELAAVSQVEARRPARAADALPDPVADYLWDHWTVYGEQDGRLHVACPWAEHHSGDSGSSQCAWTQAGVGGRAEGGVHCMHETHGGHGKLTTTAFLRLVGYTAEEVMSEFPVMTSRHEGRSEGDATDDEEGEDGDDWLPAGSEQLLAETFASRGGGERFRWTPGLEWMVNQGSHWARDELLRRMTVAREVCRDAAAGEKAQLARKLCAANTVSALLNLARSHEGVATPIEAWDAHPMLLNTPAGVIDLETGREVPREGLLFTQVTGAAPVPGPTPVWDRFLGEVFAGDLEMVEFMQRLAGYAFTGSTREHKMFFLHGAGRNGKNVFMDVLHRLGGRYAHNLASEALMTSKHQQHATTFAALHGKRLAISSEIEESAHWAEAKIKSLTGDTTMTARFMRQDEFTFPITHKHIIAGNSKPRLRGDDTAVAARMVLVPFLQTFEGARRDVLLPQKLQAEDAGIMAWVVEGARKWAQGGLAIPVSVAQASQRYMAENDDTALWLQECCTANPVAASRASVLYASFSRWKQGNGEHPASIKAFSQRMERFYRKAHTMHGAVFYGVELSAAADFDLQETAE